jgi:hypothetical protein
VKVLDQGAVSVGAHAAREVAADPSLAIVSGDPRRAERAVKALAVVGLGAIAVDVSDADSLTAAAPDLVVVDFGRTPADALRVAQDVATYAEVIAAGVRDGAWDKRVKEGVETIGRFREPPGDPRVVAFVSGRRGDAARKKEGRTARAKSARNGKPRD